MNRQHPPDHESHSELNLNKALSINIGLSSCLSGVMWVLIGLTLLTVLVLAQPAMADAPYSIQEDNDTVSADNVSPEEALEERERAQALLSELERLDQDPLVMIEHNSIQSVRERIENGNLSYGRANYETAHDHWQIAQEQAQAALIKNYDDGTARYLNSTSGYLAEYKNAGYSTVEVTQFEEEIQQLRMEDAGDLGAHREQFREAQDLHQRVESSLPPMRVVRLASLLSPLWVAALMIGGTMMIVSGIAAYLGYARGRGHAPEPEPGPTPDEEEEVTIPQLNND